VSRVCGCGGNVDEDEDLHILRENKIRGSVHPIDEEQGRLAIDLPRLPADQGPALADPDGPGHVHAGGDLVICELARSQANAEHAVIFAAEFLVWWEQAGRKFYSRRACQEDGGLRSFASDAVTVLGGWRAARRTLASAGV
jgi:hypothetical protein